MQLEQLGLPRTLESLTKISPFVPTNVHLADVHKTGLGSSAALITSLTSALLVHLDVIPESSLSEDGDNDGRRLAHNLAQYVHCQAQGKVGSGFDVSAAVFGSHLYTRFDPSVISDLMNESKVSLASASLVSSIYALRAYSGLSIVRCKAAPRPFTFECSMGLQDRTLQTPSVDSYHARGRRCG